MPTLAEQESIALRGFPSIPAEIPASRMFALPQIVEKDIPTVAVLTTGASPVTLFNTRGTIIAKVFAASSTALTSTSDNGTLAIGISGNTGMYLAAVTINTTNFPAAQATAWAGDTSATLLGELLTVGPLVGCIQTGSTPIIATIATNSLLVGAMKFWCLWYPLSSDGAVTAA